MSSMFKSPPKPKKAPLAPNEDALKKARKRSVMAQRSRSGRMSTLLSDSESLGS